MSLVLFWASRLWWHMSLVGDTYSRQVNNIVLDHSNCYERRRTRIFQQNMGAEG